MHFLGSMCTIMPMSYRAILVGIPDPVQKKIAPILENLGFTAEYRPKVSTALEFIVKITYDILIVSYPVPELSTESFLARVRDKTSRCEKTPFLFLYFPGKRREAEEYVGRGVNRVLSMDDDPDAYQDALVALLRVSPRVPHRVMIRLRSEEVKDKSILLCMTENISLTGMLLRSGRLYPVGTPVMFDFMLPRGKKPIEGKGTIVRHTLLGREKVVGMALQYKSFLQDSRERLEQFLSPKIE